MELLTLIQQNATTALQPVYFLLSAEPLLVERAVGVLKKRIAGETSTELAVEVFRGESADLVQVLQSANMRSLFAEQRLIWLRDIDRLSTLEPCLAYLQNPNPNTCLVLSGEKLDKRSKVAKAAEKAGFVCEHRALRGGALVSFVVAEATMRGHRMRSDSAKLIIEYAGEQLWALSEAVERLALYVGQGQAIESVDVERCLTRERSETVWSLIDGVSRGDARTTLLAGYDLLSRKEPPLRILSLLSRQVRMLAKIKNALNEGQSAAAAAAAAGAPPFKAQDLARDARGLSDPELNFAFHILCEADLRIKSSREPAESTLERALFALAHLKKKTLSIEEFTGEAQ